MMVTTLDKGLQATASDKMNSTTLDAGDVIHKENQILPPELLALVASHVRSKYDLRSLFRTCRSANQLKHDPWLQATWLVKNTGPCDATHVACRWGLADALQIIHRAGMANVSTHARMEDRRGYTAMHQVCMQAPSAGHLTVIRLLLELDVDLASLPERNGYTPLHLACMRGHATSVELLARTPGVKINVRDKEGMTPLHYACKHGRTAVVQVLGSTSGVDVNSHFAMVSPPLHFAVGFRHVEAVRQLLKVPDVDGLMADHRGSTPLHLACGLGDSAIVQELLAWGARDLDIDSAAEVRVDVHLTSTRPDTHTKCCESGGIISSSTGAAGESVQGLGSTGKPTTASAYALVNVLDRQGESALHVAVSNGHAAVVKLLLKTPGIKLNARSNEGTTPLHIACLCSHVEVVKLLLAQEGVDVNAAEASDTSDTWLGDTPLHNAARAGDVQVIQLLLAAPGLDVGARNKHGSTPLLLACEFGHAEVVRELLVAGSDARVKTNEGKGVREIVAERRRILRRCRGPYDQVLRTLSAHSARKACVVM